MICTCICFGFKKKYDSDHYDGNFNSKVFVVLIFT